VSQARSEKIDVPEKSTIKGLNAMDVRSRMFNRIFRVNEGQIDDNIDEYEKYAGELRDYEDYVWDYETNGLTKKQLMYFANENDVVLFGPYVKEETRYEICNKLGSRRQREQFVNIYCSAKIKGKTYSVLI
jgi:hypothetical protein